ARGTRRPAATGCASPARSASAWRPLGSEPLEPVAGVDAERLASHRLRQIRCEEHHRAGDLRRVGQVTERGLALELRLLLLVGDAFLLGQVMDVPLDLVAPDVAGVDAVHPNAVAAELAGE